MKKICSLFLLVLLPLVASADAVVINSIYYNLDAQEKTAQVTKNPNYYSGDIDIPESVNYDGITYKVTSIRRSAFADCSGLKSVTIPNSVTTIENSAFSGCSSLTSVTIPNSVTKLQSCVFQYCSGLTSVTIPNSVTEIWGATFFDCGNLTSISIPNSVTIIGAEAFAYCSSLQSLIIPNSVTSIDEEVFKGCSGLTSIVVESGNVKYDSRNNCNAIIETTTNKLIAGCMNTVIPSNVTGIADYAFQSCHGLSSVTIPSGVTNIGYSAFEGCSSLTSITIPNSVTSIESSAFRVCSGLTSIVVEEGNPRFDSRNNCNAIIETATNTLVTGCMNTVVPSSVTSIGDWSFAGCEGLTTIKIPSSVISIGDRAFDNCSGLTDFYCYAQDVPTTGARPFSYSNIDNATLHVPAGSVNDYKTTEPWSNFKDVIAIDSESSEYTLSYVVDGNEYKSYKVEEGAAITPEPAPIKEGYIFSGWSTIPETMPAEDVTITGSFQLITDEDVITLKETGKGTWCSDYDLDFTDVEGIKAYTATGYDDVDKTIWLTRVFKVPAGTGIMVKGDPGEHKIPHATVKAVYASFFKGVTGTAVTINETDGDNTNYYMAGGQFKKVNGSTTISPNRAYLQLPTLVFAGTRSIDVIYEDEIDDKTGIHSAAITSDQEPGIYYNLQGQRVDNPKKGLYIKNGKKVIIK